MVNDSCKKYSEAEQVSCYILMEVCYKNLMYPMLSNACVIYVSSTKWNLLVFHIMRLDFQCVMTRSVLPTCHDFGCRFQLGVSQLQVT